ncbi:hypothetical protein LCGC14_1457950 [marine sediment metagenome]|uniref:Uncharacterized protein n=1 Tax=marine sediment metagenome TaxID=412755 RepID=A0A0F9MHV6_9ZZZZ
MKYYVSIVWSLPLGSYNFSMTYTNCRDTKKIRRAARNVTWLYAYAHYKQSNDPDAPTKKDRKLAHISAWDLDQTPSQRLITDVRGVFKKWPKQSYVYHMERPSGIPTAYIFIVNRPNVFSNYFLSRDELQQVGEIVKVSKPPIKSLTCYEINEKAIKVEGELTQKEIEIQMALGTLKECPGTWYRLK